MNIKKILLVLLGITIAASIVFTGFIISVYLDYTKDKESIFTKLEEFSLSLDNNEKETTIPPEQTSRDVRKSSIILDRNGKIITKYADEKYRLASIKEMPYFLTRGFLLIEDRDFYNHHGINYKRFAIAVIKNIFTLGRSAGGSTISQQLAKILFTKHERNIKRKVYEYFCTKELEKRFSKNDILKIYLNKNYMGHGNYGVANASNFYFCKSPSELNIAEASLLIGMNRSPERYSPIRNKENAEHIQRSVMNSFIASGYLDKPQAEMEIKRFWSKFNEMGIAGEQSIWKTEINNSGYLTEFIRQTLEQEFDYDRITGGGLIVETTFDLEKQNLAERILTKQLKSIRTRVKEYSEKYKKDYSQELIKKVEGSFVSMDYKTGEVFAIVGGSGFSFSNQLNRAVNSYRQIGSSIKPFIYANALDKGNVGELQIHPFTKFKDEIITYTIGNKKYTPKNYYANHKYGDMVTLYDALKKSLNTVAVSVMNNLDSDEVSSFIKNAAGLDENSKRVPNVLSLALGTAELSALELASAYSIFPSGGVEVRPVVITKIYDTSGNIYFDINREVNPQFNFLKPIVTEKKQLIKPETSYEILQMMKGVFEKGGTGYWAASINGLKKTAYGKSGTTQDYKDGWFAGITNNEVSSCWVGIDSGESLLLSGEATAAIIWTDYNVQVSSDITDTIKIPANMKLVKVCRQSGLSANKNCPETMDFYFRADGPIPEKCYIHGEELPNFEIIEDNP